MVFGLLLALLALPNLVNGQGANATLLGTVTDVSGAVVPGASVQVTNVATGVKQMVTTDSQGRYTVVDLIVGSYDVQASARDFRTIVRRGITLSVGSQTVVDIAAFARPAAANGHRRSTSLPGGRRFVYLLR